MAGCRIGTQVVEAVTLIVRVALSPGVRDGDTWDKGERGIRFKLRSAEGGKLPGRCALGWR